MPPLSSPEFRRAAVARVRDSGVSIRDVAAEVGVSYESLRSWRKQEQTDLDEQFTGSERAAVRRLLLDAQVSEADTKRTARKIRSVRLRPNRAGEEPRAARCAETSTPASLSRATRGQRTTREKRVTEAMPSG